jgi:hypothetical protein
MRRFLMLPVGLFLVFSGVTTLLNPRPILVGHQRMSSIFFRSSVVFEYVSREGSVVYGACATALGLAMIYSIFLGDLRIAGSDRAIAHGILTVSPELLRRYGRIEDCTRPQIEATAKDLRIDAAIHPYLLAAFLGKEELRKSENQAPGTDWREIEDRVDRIFVELPHEELLRSHFHRSWAAADGI